MNFREDTKRKKHGTIDLKKIEAFQTTHNFDLIRVISKEADKIIYRKTESDYDIYYNILWEEE